METAIKNELIHKDMASYIRARNKQRIENRRPGYHASSLLDTSKRYCLRQHVLDLVHKPNYSEVIHEDQTLAIFEEGWSIHEKWQRIFEAANVAIEVETPHDISLFGIPLTFTPDAIIERRGKAYVVEIKGYKHENFIKIANLAEDSRMKNQGYRAARLQANWYMHLLRMNRSIILIEDKNTQEFISQEENYVEELTVPFVKKLQELAEAKKTYEQSGNLPGRICRSCTQKRALACSLREICFKEAL